MDVGDSLDTALEQAARALEPFADAFVIVARADSENGDKELFRYTGAGSSSERRGLVEVVRTFYDEADRQTYRDSD